jgi:hypothetical protein
MVGQEAQHDVGEHHERHRREQDDDEETVEAQQEAVEGLHCGVDATGRNAADSRTRAE